MARIFWVLFTIFSLISIGKVFGQDIDDVFRAIKRERFIVDNNNCNYNPKNCNLVKIHYLIEDYLVRFPEGNSFGTRMIAEYETKSLSDLEDYVFVQYIKGCQFSSTMEDNELKTITDITQINDNGTTKIIKYDDWTIEAQDNNPVYYSYFDMPRNYYYLWNTTVNYFNNRTQRFFGEYPPPHPRLYVRDRPGTAFYGGSTAKNISLEFKTCLYRSSDVPLVLGPGENINTEPIHCYQWSSSWVYDHAKNEFTNPVGISDACKK